ncbi:MAG: hypothetical protein U0Y68_23705 [Blastocatellia bacterium]
MPYHLGKVEDENDRIRGFIVRRGAAGFQRAGDQTQTIFARFLIYV